MAADPVIPFPSLTFQKKLEGDTVTVLCRGKVVSDTVSIMKEEIHPLIEKYKSVVLDLSNVSYMDSSGLGALVGLFVSAKRTGKRLKLINLSDRVGELLRLSNLLSIFEGYGEYL